jgi:hypothetical protein
LLHPLGSAEIVAFREAKDDFVFPAILNDDFAYSQGNLIMKAKIIAVLFGLACF